MTSWRTILSSQELSDKQVEDLKNVLDIQGSNGNWDYPKDDSSYMTGMYNGMEVMDSIINSRDPKFRDVVKKASWRKILSWEVKEEPWKDPTKVKSAIKKVLDGYEALGEKARKSDLIRDVVLELRCNYFTPGIHKAIDKELKRRGWSSGNYDDM